ncbi:MAG TPA: 2-phospho-L-lactate transferase [Acidimicrobiales bacterium]|nr:2-phospho-L-lactate transferase [Acidimicrobiales bacterium]
MTRVCALAGGVGAAKMLRGVMRAVRPTDVTAVVNTGDDVVLHGLHISPDLDTITYTLAEAINPETGWGLAGESWQAMTALDRYRGLTWFRLGDKDLATHLYRTQRLRDGASLADVTAEITQAWDIDVRVIPVTEDRLETRVTVDGEGEIGFQEYFVGRQHNVTVTDVRFAGAEEAHPTPGVLAALADADVVLICPSNPIVSIGPVLAVPGVRAAVEARRADAVAVSPIVAGTALKGPADRMLRELGHDASVVGVARLYRDLAATLVIDEADRDLAPAVEDAGMRCVVAPTIMHDADAAAALARVCLDAASSPA